MKKSLLEIYALAVCFFTVACFVVVLGMTLWDVVQLSAPEFTIDNRTYEIHQSDETYSESLTNTRGCDGEKKVDYKPPEGQALTEARDKSYAQELRSERRGALQELMQKLIVLLVDLIVFVIHWKVGAYARRNAS